MKQERGLLGGLVAFRTARLVMIEMDYLELSDDRCLWVLSAPGPDQPGKRAGGNPLGPSRPGEKRLEVPKELFMGFDAPDARIVGTWDCGPDAETDARTSSTSGPGRESRDTGLRRLRDPMRLMLHNNPEQRCWVRLRVGKGWGHAAIPTDDLSMNGDASIAN
ncbi:hypothetical protein LY76DRAFT_604171 [Colletotrichum caudatum]|nr:hypothetical protein LY76DRAFT_604171 [Colletotrichum caudatum]